jgi:hypothetical protein
MQHQVPDAVGLFIGTPPDLIVGHGVQAMEQLRKKILPEKHSRRVHEFFAH